MRLTDQALLAVTLGRAGAAREDHTSVADLVVGLAAEPEGRAGLLLRRQANAATALAVRAAAASPRLPVWRVAVGWAHRDVAARPLSTTDLLDAAVEVGGSDLADLLEACGYDLAELAAPTPEALSLADAVELGALSETYGYDPAATDATPPAGRAVSRSRAVGGGALALVAALAQETSARTAGVGIDGETLLDRLRSLGAAGACAAGQRLSPADPAAWDRGLDPVLDTARTIVGRAPIHPAALLHAAAVVGGRGPARVLTRPPG